MFPRIIVVWILFFPVAISAQNKNDSVIVVDGKLITLSEIVIDNKLNVPSFINRVKNDTTFYKAFRTLHIVGFTALNDIRMVDKKGDTKASLRSKIKQIRKDNCRSMKVLEETATGDIYDRNKNFNYYTGEMYAGIFFTKGTICGENNVFNCSLCFSIPLNPSEENSLPLTMLFSPQTVPFVKKSPAYISPV